MLTRGEVYPRYGVQPYGAPPFHVTCHPAAYPAPNTRQGGFSGGVVALNMPPAMNGGTGYGYLGMDPTDPESWPRPFRPAPGMLSRNITRIEYELSGLR